MSGKTEIVEYVRITDDEHGDETKLEIPVDPDLTISLTTLAHAFPGAYGLKYRNPDTGAFRALKVDESGRVLSPNDQGWQDLLYVVIFHRTENKRKMDSAEGSASKQKKMEERRCSDLIVLGLSFSVNEDELRKYFEQYGAVLVAQVKRDFKSGNSKGFGFIRYAEFESQVQVLSEKHHEIGGRTCEVKIPDSQKATAPTPSKKVFVGRVPDTMLKEELKEYFETYGEVTDVFIPRPFRSFAFVTFSDGDVAQSLCGQDHIIKNCSVHVGHATPKDPKLTASPGGSGQPPQMGNMSMNNMNMPSMPNMHSSPPQHQDYAPPAGKMRMPHNYNSPMPPKWNGPVDCPPTYYGGANRGAGNNGGEMPPWRFQTTDLTQQGGINPMPPPPPPQYQQQPQPPAPYVPTHGGAATATLASGTQQAMQGMNNLNLNSLIGSAVNGAQSQQAAINNLQQVISQAFMMGLASAGAIGGSQAATGGSATAPSASATSAAQAGVAEQLMALLGTMQQQQSRDGSGWYPTNGTPGANGGLLGSEGGDPSARGPPQSEEHRSPSNTWKQTGY